MRIVATGATGFIGRPLCEALLQSGHTVVVLTRSPSKVRTALPAGVEPARWNPAAPDPSLDRVLAGAGAVVNLAGESIGAGRWTPARKRAILHSRLDSTRALVEAMGRLTPTARPRVLVSASGVDYYGDRASESLDEDSPPGAGFASEVTRAWEAAASAAEQHGVRVVVGRFGLVLGLDEGGFSVVPMARRLLFGTPLPPNQSFTPLQPLLVQFKLFVGGPLGSGNQWWSWVHRADLIRWVQHVVEREEARGAFNVAAPEPLPQKEFAATLGRVLGRPSFFPTPAFLLKIALGEKAESLLLSSHRVLPRRTQASGFTFQFPRLEPALRDVLRAAS